MLQSILSCFACGDKTQGNVVAPEIMKQSEIKVKRLNQSEIKTDDNISRVSMTTVTFLTSQTAPTKDEDDDQQIRRRIQVLRTKQLPERKAMESQFIRNNLNRSNMIYLIDKVWSEDYTKFLKSHKITSMPPINNQRLIDSNGQLKPTLKQKQDYFIVTEKIWKLIQGFYGGGPAIPKDSCFPVINILMKKVSLGFVGIQNPLNLCFMISVLQMLFSIEQFNGYMTKKSFAQSSENKKKIYHNLLFKVIKHYIDAQNQQKCIEIKQFASFFQERFEPKEQHDAHEFMLHLFQLLQQEMKVQTIVPNVVKPQGLQAIYSQYFKQNKSIIDKLFVGQQETTVFCQKCDYKSITYVPFFQIVLSILNMDNIERCLDNYFEAIRLQDLYECQKCKKKSRAIKSTRITKAPHYLIVVLGKFSCTTLKKVNHRIKYDLSLNIQKYTFGHCGQTKYSLQSLIIHQGSKSTKGHYYTISKRGQKNNWIMFDDGVTKQMDEEMVLEKDPYILVYERVRLS